MVVAATGFFDGVHKGHRAVLQTLKDTARAKSCESAIITFWPHPRTVLQQDASTFRLLTALDEKKELVHNFGIDKFIVIPFTKDFSKKDAATFLKEYLMEHFGVSTLIVGYDHRLGNSSCSSREELQEIAHGLGLETVVVNEVNSGEVTISSTKIRAALAAGDVATANEMLGYNYSLRGVVVLGNMIGRTIGFPTANMQLYEPLKMLPANGVYFVKVSLSSGEYTGICNVGNRPTVGNNNNKTIETHILDFNEDIYGLDIRIEFVARLRDEMKFSSLEQLKERISLDKEFVRNNF